MSESAGSLDPILNLVGENRLEEADAACEAALDASPDDVNIVALMGAIRMARDDLDSAESLLRRAIDIEPAFLRPRKDLAALYLAREDFQGAIVQFRKIISMAPDHAPAMRGLATALERAGRDDEADTVREQFMDRLPIDALLAEAEVLSSRGETAEAEALCDAVLRREPEHIGALRVLAKAADADDRHIIAEAFLKRIVRLLPDDAEALTDLGKFLTERSRYPEAIECFEAAGRLAPDNAEVPLCLGNLYSILDRSAEAAAAYDRCLSLEPANASALVGRGHILRIEGRQDEARAAYERCVSESPDFGAAWWYLASLHRYAASDDDVAIMEQQLAADDVLPESAVGLHFALARAAEKQDDFDSAWDHYVNGNRAKRALVSYDPVKVELEQRKIRETFTRDLIASSDAAAADDATPIFIVGMPRSGSTLVEQVLASHSQIEGTGELPYILMMTASMVERLPGTLNYTELVGGLDGEELSRMGASYIANSVSYRSEGQPYFTDKMPANFAHLGFMRMILPDAKFIDARRDPLATCVANYRQLFAQGKNQSYDLVELGEYYLGYLAMMEHWDNVMPGEVLHVQYEDVVDDLESEARRILDFCGLPFEDACLEFHKSARRVNTASAEQVREPIYRSGVDYWKNYEPWLDELKAVLGPAT